MTSAARISSRNSPKVRTPSRRARLATTIAARVNAMLTASVAMCAASESRASESATNAVTTSTTTNTAVRTKANQSRPTFLAAVRRMASEWSCAPA